MTKKIIQFVAILLVCIITIVPSAFAATGYQGYAVGREGAGINPSTHNAIMYGVDKTVTKAVIHIAVETGQKVDYGTWSSFVGVHTYYGAYKPNSNPTSAQRDKVLATSDELYKKRDSISYTVLGQRDYPASVFNKTKVEPSAVIAIRCDGVIEYCNEYNGIQIAGGVFWNISIPTWDHINAHCLASVTPRSQLLGMTYVGL